VAILAGCDNAHVSLSMGDWREGGSAEPPILRMKGEPIVNPIAAGQGEPARAGDLVKVSVIVTSPPVNEHHAPLPRQAHVVWVWTGRDEGNSWLWGHPGIESVRRTLIGRQPGERFELAYGPDAEGVVLLPLQGLMEPELESFQLNAVRHLHDGQYYRARRWPALDLRPAGYGPARAEIEILTICPAKRFYRTAVMKQRGYVPPMGDMAYNASREGVLHWSAIEASCPAPVGTVRFEAGPFYFPKPGDPGSLMNWRDSYVGKRPPPDNPAEWEAVKQNASRR
jgi:hypothetical protein